MTPDRNGPKRDSSGRGHTPADQIRYWLVEERRRLVAAVSGLTEQEALRPMGPGQWSVYAILAHRLFWEGREVEALGQHLLGKRVELLDFPNRRVDGTNAVAIDTLHDYDTNRLLRALGKTRGLLMALVEKISDDDLNAHGNAARIVLGVALEHDREHSRQIIAWREQQGGSGAGPTNLTPNLGAGDQAPL